MKRLTQRGLVPGVLAMVAIAAILAACAPTGGGGGGGPTTLPTIPDTVPDCITGALGTITLGEEPIDVEPGFAAATNLADVCFNFGAAGAMRAVFMEQCWAPSTLPGFNVSIHCYKGGEININPAANPTGKGHFEFRIFRGAEPSGDSDWGCFAPGDVVPPGITAHSTCYVRVTLDSFANNGEALSKAFTLKP